MNGRDRIKLEASEYVDIKVQRILQMEQPGSSKEVIYGCGKRGHADKGHADGWRERKRCRRQGAIEEDHLFWCPS